MTSVIVTLGLLSFLGVLGYFKFRRDKQSGVIEERLRHAEQDVIHLRKEGDKLANRPRNINDTIKRLRKWRDRTGTD